MQKAIFLDRDGVINYNSEYVYKIEDFKLIKGVIEALKLLQKNNYKLFIITNQSGIARGYYTENDFKKLNNYMINLFKKNDIIIKSVQYCPHHIEGRIKKYSIKCDCRKPDIGMFKRILSNYKIDINNSFMIGDSKSDIIAGNKLNLKTILISNNKNNIDFNQNFTAADLLFAVKKIILKNLFL